ncbi:MAG: Pycsar system effector family protein [Propionibacteriaceae bacterium]|nr:hypothetical protein [Micropruina sp.]HBX82375.1 hypothetical protein [Propionibacteriaceae bacterium]
MFHRRALPPLEVRVARESPDRHWPLYLAINGWIAHAESKAGATLAFIGAASAGLVVLLPKPKDMTVLMSVFVVSCSLLLILAATLACLSIWPRLGRSDAPENPLYYRHLSERFGTPFKAQQAVNAALSDDEAYVKHLSAQIVANATVATRKYRWVGRSIVALVVALVCLLGALLTQWFGW